MCSHPQHRRMQQHQQWGAREPQQRPGVHVGAGFQHPARAPLLQVPREVREGVSHAGDLDDGVLDRKRVLHERELQSRAGPVLQSTHFIAGGMHSLAQLPQFKRNRKVLPGQQRQAQRQHVCIEYLLRPFG